jgi:hypothetical protein
MSGPDIPAPRTLQFLRWTREPARQALPYVTWRGSDAYIGDRQIVFPEDQETVIEQCYKEMPPTIGYIRFYRYISKSFVGVRRRAVQTFLRKKKGHGNYRQHNRRRQSKNVAH